MKIGHWLAALGALGAASVGAAQEAAATTSNRYGWFGALDHRSVYGRNWFPEPLRADEADVDNELRFDYFHGEQRGRQVDEARAEFEKSFGLLTLEVGGGYESDRTSMFNPDTGATEREREEGFTNVELAARHPVFQYVSPGGAFDTTVVFGLEVAPPVMSKISRDTEIVPKVFDLTKIGEHLSLQLGLGDSILIGPVGHGLSTLEYDVVLGYELTHDQAPVPGIHSITPILEFDGEYTLNQDEAGDRTLFGTVGARVGLEPISWLPAQPRLGIGYTFPIDSGARDELHWGIVTSLVFEY